MTEEQQKEKLYISKGTLHGESNGSKATPPDHLLYEVTRPAAFLVSYKAAQPDPNEIFNQTCRHHDPVAVWAPEIGLIYLWDRQNVRGASHEMLGTGELNQNDEVSYTIDLQATHPFTCKVSDLSQETQNYLKHLPSQVTA